MMNSQKMVRGLVLVVFVFVLAGYTLFETRHLIEGPVVMIESPGTRAHTTNPLVSIEGATRNVTYIALNDRPIFVDEKGRFEEKLLLPPGYTIMKVVARDRFDRETEAYIELTYSPTL